MQGALFVVDATGERRDTICEGLRFTDDPANPHRVTLRVAASMKECGPLAHLIEGAASWMEALRWEPAAADFAQGFFAWLAVFWRDDAEHKPGRVRALYFARIKGRLSEAPSRNRVEPAVVLAFAQKVLARTLRAHVELRDPQTSSEAILEACSNDFARLADE